MRNDELSNDQRDAVLTALRAIVAARSCEDCVCCGEANVPLFAAHSALLSLLPNGFELPPGAAFPQDDAATNVLCEAIVIAAGAQFKAVERNYRELTDLLALFEAEDEADAQG